MEHRESSASPGARSSPGSEPQAIVSCLPVHLYRHSLIMHTTRAPYTFPRLVIRHTVDTSLPPRVRRYWSIWEETRPPELIDCVR